MTKQGQEFERAKAILEQFIVAMPVQAGRDMVAIVGGLADQVGRLKTALARLEAGPYRADCNCDACKAIRLEVFKELEA